VRKVISDIACDADQIWVSKGWEVTFPHIIVGRTRDGRAKRVRIRSGSMDCPDPGLLDEQNVSSSIL